MSNNDIDSSKAKEIVSYFLAQSHIVLDVKESVFDDHAWIVDAEVTSFGVNHIKRIRVNAETGRIMHCESDPNP